jgi:hypothetical protein
VHRSLASGELLQSSSLINTAPIKLIFGMHHINTI